MCDLTPYQFLAQTVVGTLIGLALLVAAVAAGIAVARFLEG